MTDIDENQSKHGLEGCDICQDVRDNPPKQTKLEKLNLDQSV
jgi:hypothetical protein